MRRHVNISRASHTRTPTIGNDYSDVGADCQGLIAENATMKDLTPRVSPDFSLPCPYAPLRNEAAGGRSLRRREARLQSHGNGC